MLPQGHDMEKLESTLNSDGILTITAPRVEQEAEKVRSIPIQREKEVKIDQGEGEKK